MKKTTLYITCVDGKERVSFKPQSLTSCYIKYHLSADEDKVLYNKKLDRYSQAVNIPAWELEDWEELRTFYIN